MRLDGFSREGWRQVGQGGAARRGDLSHTNHELDNLVALARAAQVSLDTVMSDTIASIQQGDGAFIKLHHDATPLFLKFGQLQERLLESSRYLVRNGVKWHSVTYQEYLQIRGKSAPTTAGVVEVLAVNAPPFIDS